jgi:hypothetical protein
MQNGGVGGCDKTEAASANESEVCMRHEQKPSMLQPVHQDPLLLAGIKYESLLLKKNRGQVIFRNYSVIKTCFIPRDMKVSSRFY